MDQMASGSAMGFMPSNYHMLWVLSNLAAATNRNRHIRRGRKPSERVAITPRNPILAGNSLVVRGHPNPARALAPIRKGNDHGRMDRDVTHLSTLSCHPDLRGLGKKAGRVFFTIHNVPRSCQVVNGPFDLLTPTRFSGILAVTGNPGPPRSGHPLPKNKLPHHTPTPPSVKLADPVKFVHRPFDPFTQSDDPQPIHRVDSDPSPWYDGVSPGQRPAPPTRRVVSTGLSTGYPQIDDLSTALWITACG